MMRIVVLGVRLIADIGRIVGTQDDTTLLLDRKRPILVSLRVKSPDVSIQKAVVESLLGLLPFTRRETTIAIFVEASSNEVVKLPNHAITIEIVAGIWNAANLPSLLQL